VVGLFLDLTLLLLPLLLLLGVKGDGVVGDVVDDVGDDVVVISTDEVVVDGVIGDDDVVDDVVEVVVDDVVFDVVFDVVVV
jgi:hypothetical protein